MTFCRKVTRIVSNFFKVKVSLKKAIFYNWLNT
jgi:hypothetical protein